MTEVQRIRNLSVPEGSVDCVLDTDTYNEIDDQYALSLLCKHGKPNVRAIYACPFCNSRPPVAPDEGMEQSYQEILKLLDLIGTGTTAKKENVFRGSTGYLTDEKTFRESEAAHHLCSLSAEYSADHPLYVVSIGCLTNIASALLMDPSVAERIVLVWLGGNHPTWGNSDEFNMIQDIAAARVVFRSGCPIIQLPCMPTVAAFTISGPELEYWLMGKNTLCDYLARHTIEAAESYAKGTPWTRTIWDVTAVAWLINDKDRFLTSHLTQTPVPEYDRYYGYAARTPLMRIVDYVNRDALMEELFRVLLL